MTTTETPAEPAVPKFAIVGDYLCVDVGKCTCGCGVEPFGHEPYCGVEPAASLAEMDALLRADAARQITAVEETQPGLWRVTYASGDTAEWPDSLIRPVPVEIAELQARQAARQAGEMRAILDHKRSGAES